MMWMILIILAILATMQIGMDLFANHVYVFVVVNIILIYIGCFQRSFGYMSKENEGGTIATQLIMYLICCSVAHFFMHLRYELIFENVD